MPTEKDAPTWIHGPPTSDRTWRNVVRACLLASLVAGALTLHFAEKARAARDFRRGEWAGQCQVARALESYLEPPDKARIERICNGAPTP